MLGSRLAVPNAPVESPLCGVPLQLLKRPATTQDGARDLKNVSGINIKKRLLTCRVAETTVMKKEFGSQTSAKKSSDPGGIGSENTAAWS